MNEIGEAEVAGFMDGDGCIGIYRVKRRRASSWHYFLNVIFSQSREDKAEILKDIQAKYGGVIHRVKERPRCAPAFALRMSGDKAINLIRSIRPFLRVKCPQAEIAERFMEYRIANAGSARKGMSFKAMRLLPEHNDFYESLRIEMRECNHRGTP